MAVEIKLAPDEKLELVRAQITDATLNSNYFNVTELSDTFSGGKNAFLIAGSELLEPNTEVKVQIRDSVGKVLYCEFSDGSPDEYYEGISKVVAVYVYPTETAFGPATITLVGQTKDTLEIVKWQRTINIDPSLPNTTRVRFYKRPIVSIVEQLSPIYAFDTTGSKVASLVTQSFANIKVSQLDTFAGDVKRVKVYRTSEGDISDYDLIQDILVESKELLTTTALSGSVVGEAGLFTSETLKKLWNTGSLNAALTSSKIDNGLSLKGSGNLRYTSSLNLTNGNTYELGIDAFYSSSTTSNMGIYVSGSQNGAKLVGTLTGIVPTKNLKDQVFAFTLDKAEPTASLYLSQSQSEWHVGNISLKVSEDSAFSPSEISFVTSMPTVLGNETYNFKFEFYDVNNNYVPVAVTQSALFSGGNNNIGGTLILISGSTSASNASILALSQSVSGTIGTVTGSISQSFVTSSLYSASLQSSSLFISASVSGTISSVSQSASSSLSLVSRSLSSSIGALSSSQATTFSDVNSRIFTDASGLVNKAPSNTAAGLYLGQSYLGYHNGNGLVTGWKTYMANNGNFFLTSSAANGGYLAWDSSAATLVIKGSIDITSGPAATQISNAALSGSNAQSTANTATASAAAASQAATNASNAATYALTNANTASISAADFKAAAAAASASVANEKIFTSTTGLINKAPTPGTTSGLYLGSKYMGYYNGTDWKTYMSSSGDFYLSGTDGYLQWNAGADSLSIKGNITATTGYIGNSTNGFAINGNYIGNGKSSISDAAAGVYIGNDGIALGASSEFKVTQAGAITAKSGLIGGWDINATSLSKGNISLNSSTTQIQVGTGDGRVLINTETFANRFDPTTTAKSISIGPGGIILKGAHTTGTPQSYIYLLQEGDAARQVITSTNLGVEPLAIYGHPTGNSSAAVVVYNGGLQARNFAFTAGGTAYPGTGNGGYAIKSVGNFYTEGTGTFTGDVTANTSDKRLKTNIKNIDSPLEKISKINGVYFNWNEKAKELIAKDTEKREVGLIAQEIEDVLPEIIKPAPFDVTIDENVTDRVMYKSKSGKNYLTIQYEKIVPLLVECIKELKLEIEELKKNR